MPIRIDLPYLRYPEEARALLQGERMDALKRVVTGANERKAHVLVVAGDLFDGTNPKVATIKGVASILRGFEGDRVLVLPGNHDHCGQRDGALWPRFRAASDGDRIVVLDRPELYGFEVADHYIEFFPCPCQSKTSPTHAIGWVKDASKRPGAIHIGIAHGNVQGLGLDGDERYFNMSDGDLADAGVHTWLLGHIHRPAPDDSGSGPRPYFMAGSTTPESVRRNHEGSAWSIDVGSRGVERFERFRTGELTFRRIQRTFSEREGIEAVEALRREIKAFPVAKTVLDVVADGELAREVKEQVASLANEIRNMGFLHAGFDADGLTERLSLALIAARYPEDTNAYRLLNRLLESTHPNDAATAFAAMNVRD
jgi:DNA repair exonuclease SbcCD nuclease subunit